MTGWTVVASGRPTPLGVSHKWTLHHRVFLSSGHLPPPSVSVRWTFTPPRLFNLLLDGSNPATVDVVRRVNLDVFCKWTSHSTGCFWHVDTSLHGKRFCQVDACSTKCFVRWTLTPPSRFLLSGRSLHFLLWQSTFCFLLDTELPLPVLTSSHGLMACSGSEGFAEEVEKSEVLIRALCCRQGG